MARSNPVPEPTLEQLVLAYRHESKPGWPTTFEAAMAHPIYSICIRQIARTLHRPAWDFSHHRPTRIAGAPPVPPTPDGPRTVRGPTVPAHRQAKAPAFMHRAPDARVGTHDAKRAAANDRDD